MIRQRVGVHYGFNHQGINEARSQAFIDIIKQSSLASYVYR